MAGAAPYALRERADTLCGVPIRDAGPGEDERFLDRVLAHSLDSTHSTLGLVALLTPDGEHLEVVATRPPPEPGGGGWAGCRVIPVRGNVIGAVVQRDRPKLSDDVGRDPDGAVPGVHAPLRRFLGVPLHLRDILIGVLGVAGKRSRYTAADEHLLTAFGDHAVAAIDNARLHRRQREAAGPPRERQGPPAQEPTQALVDVPGEERLRQAHEAGMRALVAVSRHLDSATDLPTFFGCLSQTVADLVGARRASFWRLLPDNRLIVQPEPFGFTYESRALVEVQLEPGGEAVLEQAVFHDGASLGQLAGARLASYRELLALMGVTNAIAVSWRAGDRILGALAAFDADHDFNEGDVCILRVAARAAGLVWQYKQAEAELNSTVGLLRRTLDDRRRLHRELLAVTETERRCIASDIHDDVMQKLTAAELRLQRLRTRVPHGPERQLVEDVAAMVGQTDDALRLLLFDLRPPALDLPGGLTSAIRTRLRILERDSGIRTELHVADGDVPAATAQTVFRLLQEGMVNAATHSGASSLVVSLERRDGGLLARIRDDGCGFAVDTVQPSPGHLGLTLLRERVELAGGWFTLDSEMGVGTTVELWVPIDPG
jgi:signal transduction histidine kinase